MVPSTSRALSTLPRDSGRLPKVKVVASGVPGEVTQKAARKAGPEQRAGHATNAS